MPAPCNRSKGTQKPPRTPRKRQILIGNGMHSPASTTTLESVTSIFLIGNEFRFRRARQENPHAPKSSMGHPASAKCKRGEMSEKLKLGENHRRVVSVLLRGLEQMCDEIEARLAEVPGVLRQVKSDLSHAQSAALREMTARVREEIRRLNTEIELDAAVRSPRRAILALLSASIVNLEESDSKR